MTSAAHRTNHIECGLAGAEVASFHLREAISECYRLDVEIHVGDLDAEASALLGTDATLTWSHGSRDRRCCGIARSVRTLWRQDGVSAFQIEVVPALALLALRRDTRVFQDMTALEIVESVLGEGLAPYGRSVEPAVDAALARREMCVQYQESDLDFVQRLLEEEGIHYCFDHLGDAEVLRLADTNESFSPSAHLEAPVRLDPEDRAQADEMESIRSFVLHHAPTTTSVVVREHDWTRALSAVEKEDRAEDTRGRDRERYEHGLGQGVTLAEYASPSYGENDAERQALTRAERDRRDAIVGEGTGDVTSFAAGATFELDAPGAVGLGGEYVLLRVEHEDGRDGYVSRFECLPKDVVIRPARRSAKPSIGGVQTAIVTGPSGEEIHVDEHGRIKVRFPWDRSDPTDDSSSCWARVRQHGWAGEGWGFWWVPRVGMEVLVCFLDGDPDRPLVLGAAYDSTHVPPYAMPDDKSKSTIKSASSPGSDGFNEWRFEDKAGDEQVFVHAQKDYDEVVKNDHTTQVHHDQSNEVDNDQTQTVHNNQSESVGANQTMLVEGNRTVHVEGNYTESVSGTETRTVSGDVTIALDANETRSVSAGLTEDIGADETRSIGSNLTETIGGAHTQEISGTSSVSVSGALSETILGGVSITTPAAWDVTATGGLDITAAGGITFNADGGWNVAAPGGVQQVDCFEAWIGGAKRLTGGMLQEICLLKTEIIGDHVGIVSGKMEATATKAKDLGCIIEIKAIKDTKAASHISAEGLLAQKFGFTKEG